MPRNLVVFFDGTWNDKDTTDQRDDTNVVRLSKMMRPDADQEQLYVKGIGTDDDWGDTLDGMIGRGARSKMREGHAFLDQICEPQDKVFIFGFSRGAATARMLANKIHDDGVNGCRSVAMLGLWDTVAAFGLSRNVLSVIDWQQLNLRYKLSIPPSVDYVCHAVAIDEKREAFYPTLATPGKQNADRSNIEEVWFAGNHGDVGGGWTDDRGLADVTLRFMASRAMQHGLRFDGTMLPAGEVSGAETVHEADEKDLEKFGRKEREIHVLAFDGKMDVEATDTPKVHQSVFDRLRANSGYRPPNLLRNGSLAQLEQRVEIVPWAPEPDIA